MSEWTLSPQWIATFNQNHSNGVRPPGNPVAHLGLIAQEAPAGTAPSAYLEVFEGDDETEALWATATAPSSYVGVTAPLDRFSQFSTSALRDVAANWHTVGPDVKFTLTAAQRADILSLLNTL